jgi:NADH-quinone oxidoreductase subunit M
MSAGAIPILSVMILLPVLAAIACLYLRSEGARILALTVTLAQLLLGIWLWISYDVTGPQWQFVEDGSLALMASV